MQENLDISHLRVLPRATPNGFFSIMFILDERLLIKEEHQHSIQIYGCWRCELRSDKQ